MDPFKYTFIAHRGMAHCNPISAAKADQVVELLSLTPDARVLDIGCGKAEMLLRIIERYGCRGLGVDRSPPMIAAAAEEAGRRGLSSRLDVKESDGTTFQAAPGSFDMAMCIGATESLGKFAACVAKLAEWVRPGRYILAGEGFWKCKPPETFLAALDATPDDYLDHAGNVGAGVAAGLIPHYATVSSEDEWDRYEWLHCRNIELYAATNPQDPDVPDLLARRRGWRDLYLKCGRDTLGFGLYLFRK